MNIKKQPHHKEDVATGAGRGLDTGVGRVRQTVESEEMGGISAAQARLRKEDDQNLSETLSPGKRVNSRKGIGTVIVIVIIAVSALYFLMDRDTDVVVPVSDVADHK